MATYDQRAQATAARMLAPKPKGKGMVVTLSAPGSAGTFDAATDTATAAGSPVQHKGSGVEQLYDAFSIAQGMVEATDVRFLLSPLKLNGQPMPEPDPDSWTLSYQGGKPMTIKRVRAIRPAGVLAYYELQLATA